MSTFSITSRIPAGTHYRFNPYARQGDLPWTVVAASPRPKMSLPPSPVASDSSDDGLTQVDMSVENGSFDRSTVSTPSVTCLPPLRHHVPSMPAQAQYQMPMPVQHYFPQHHHQQQQQAPITPRRAVSSSPSDGCVAGNVHTALSQYPVRYMSYADLKSVPPAMASQGPTVKLFVGQVLHELRPTELSTLFSLLANTSQVKVIPHGPGCFFVELPASQFRNARQLNARVLFDVHGLWFAEGPVEAKSLQEYVASVKEGMKHDGVKTCFMRLPRSTLVVRR